MTIVACSRAGAPKPTEPQSRAPDRLGAELAHALTSGPHAPISGALRVRAPRLAASFPEVAPDLSEEPRWPLTGMQHPSLQPSFDIADALAEPGITWTDLCARGVDRRRDPSRHDELVYLAGWCAAARHDARAAIAQLAQVRGSAVSGIAHAVPFDVADILVDSQDAEHADQVLERSGLRNASLYDVLAAAYFEIGRNDDALQATAAALQLDDRRDEAATCHRLARSAMLSPTAARPLIVGELTSAAHHRVPHQTCIELAAAVPCVLESSCDDYRTLHQIDHGTLELARIAEQWTLALTWQDWIVVAWQVRNTVARPQSAEMFDDAIDAAVVASECDVLALRSIAASIDNMFAPVGTTTIAPKAAWARVLYDKPDECASFRARWLAANPQ